MKFAGFIMLQFTKNPKYTKTGGAFIKNVFDSTPEPTDLPYSFAFYGDEVMRADGEVHMYARNDDPEQRGTIMGFDKRFISMPIRNTGIGAIVGDNA